MFNDIPKLLLGLALLGPSLAFANVFHWEAHSENTQAYWLGEGGGENFLISGGFDFNSETNTISNITVKTSANSTGSCVACNDFSDGGIGELSSILFYGAVTFTESDGPNIYFPWKLLATDFRGGVRSFHARQSCSNGYVVLGADFAIRPI